MKRKLLLAALCVVGALGFNANAQTDVTESYVGDLSKIVVGSHTHGDKTVEHRLNQASWPEGSAWWNDQPLPSGWHAFAAPGTSGTGESWTSGFGSAGVMMGRTMNLPEGNYTLSFAAFGCNASNSSDPSTLPTAGDVVAFCTGQDNVDITNTASAGDNTFHNVSFTFDVTSANSTYSFGIRKLTDDSKIDWCQIKDVTLVLNSTNITPIANNVTTGWTQTFDSEESQVGDFAANVASVEGNSDGTNYLAPFNQVWKASGNILSNQTISNTFTPTETGVYKMSAWVRVYNESGGSVSGAKIFIGDTEADACTGSEITNGRLGTYTAMADGVAGTPISYGFKIEDASMNWISWKDVTFTYYAEMPDAEKTALLAQVPSGKMNATVQTTLAGYVSAFESNASVANYNTLSLYIPTATASVEAYTNINTAISTYATLAESLDAAGQAAYDASAIQTKYDNATYESYAEAEAELSAAYVVAVKAQTTANSDMTAAVAGAACTSAADFSNWSITGGEGANFELNTWSSESDASGLVVPFIQNWRAAGTPLNDATIRHATISGLHAGNYKVTVFARTFNENNTTVYPKNVTFVAIGDDTWSVDMNSGTQAIYNSKSTLCYGTYTAYATLADEGSIQFGFNISDATANWLAFKNVTLTLVSDDEVEAAKLTNAKANLTAALVDAPAVPAGNIGTDVFQYNQSEAEALSATLTAAQAMLEDGSTATLSEVEAMIVTVKALTDVTQNVPSSSTHYNLIASKATYGNNGKAVTVTKGEENQKNGDKISNATGYSFNASATPTAYLAQALTFTQVEGNTYNISFETAQGTVYLTYGSLNGSEVSWNTGQIQGTTNAENKGTFKIVATSTDNVFNIYNTITNSVIAAQTGGSLYTEAENNEEGKVNAITFTVAEASQASVTVKVDADKYATAIFPFAPGAIDGITFYSCEAVNGDYVQMEAVAEPAANTPYILKASKAVDTTVSGWGTAAATEYTVGYLTGVYTAATIAASVAATETVDGADRYVLQTQEDTQAFYKVSADFTATANKAYLTVPVAKTGAGAKAFYFNFNDANAIEAITALTSDNIEGIYTVGGAKVNSLQKGINIVKMQNGETRKVFVK